MNCKLAFWVLLGALLASAPAFTQDNATTVARTRIKMLTPFGPAGLSIGMAVTQQLNGTCFTRSVASPTRDDAWRCSAGNAIMDPCYHRIMGDEKQLACPVGGPWPANVVLLTLTQALPQDEHKAVSRDSSLPWALELANGQRCSLFTGATAPIAGMRINYGCPGGFVVVGDIDRSQPAWRVFFQGEKSIALEQVDVAVAWF